MNPAYGEARKISDERLRPRLFYYPRVGLTVPTSLDPRAYLPRILDHPQKYGTASRNKLEVVPLSVGVALILCTRKTSRIYAFMRYTDVYAFLRSLCNASFLTLLSFSRPRSRDASDIISFRQGNWYLFRSFTSLCVQPSNNLSAGGRSYRNFDICHRQGTSSRDVLAPRESYSM